MEIDERDIDRRTFLLEETLEKETTKNDKLFVKSCLLQLGICYLKKRNSEKSIFYLQKCLRLDEDSYEAWQCLGEAYYARGSYQNALKAFERAIQLRPNYTGEEPGEDVLIKLPPMNQPVEASIFFEEYKIALIKSILGCNEESIKMYHYYLEKRPDSIEGLIGIGAAKLQMAQDLFTDDREKAFEICGQILCEIDKINDNNVDPSIPFEMSSNCCCLCLKEFPNDVDCIRLGGEELTREQLLSKAFKFTMDAIKLKSSPALWYNLYFLYFYKFSMTKDMKFLEKAFYCLAKSNMKRTLS